MKKTSKRKLRAGTPRRPGFKTVFDSSASLGPYTLRALGGRVIVRMEATKEKTQSGLYVPETARAPYERLSGVVVGVGPGELDINGDLHKPDVKLGDRVLLSSQGGFHFNYDGLLVVDAGSLIAVLT